MCSKVLASKVPAILTDVLFPKLRADCVILRAAALRWPTFATAEAKKKTMRRFGSGNIETERANCKKILLDIAGGLQIKSFSPAISLILDRIWDRNVPLELAEVCRGMSPVNPADEALAREIIESALSIQADAEKAPTEQHKTGSFGGCDSSCCDDHHGMACDVCGVDYGWHRGICSIDVCLGVL